MNSQFGFLPTFPSPCSLTLLVPFRRLRESPEILDAIRKERSPRYAALSPKKTGEVKYQRSRMDSYYRTQPLEIQRLVGSVGYQSDLLQSEENLICRSPF